MTPSAGRGARRLVIYAACAAASLTSARPGAAASAPSFLQETELVARPAAAGQTAGSLEARIKRPVGAAARLPALIVIGGVETGAGVLDLLDPDVPVVLATFEYPYRGPRRFEFPRTLIDAPRIKAAVAETPSDLLLLHRALRTKPYVDPDRVCVVGASFAAPLVTRAAADYPELRCVIIVHGFADVEGTAAHRMRQLWGRSLGPLTRPCARLLSRLLMLYFQPPRPEEDAPRLRADQRVLVVEAGEDTIIPAASRRLLWDSLTRSHATVERVVMPGEHVLASQSPRTIGDIMAIVERWLPVRRAAGARRVR